MCGSPPKSTKFATFSAAYRVYYCESGGIGVPVGMMVRLGILPPGSNSSRIRTSVQVALIVGACTVLAPLYGPSIRARAATPQDDLDKSYQGAGWRLSILEQNYADPISSEKAIYQGAIPGMLRTLDPHSNFLDPNEYQDMQRKQRAQYFGIGMLISMDGTKVIAHGAVPRLARMEADLRRGDVIIAVDGKDVTKKDSQDVADMLRGRAATRCASR